MGDNFLKQQVRNFRKGRDRALGVLDRPTLFRAPELLRTTYPVTEANGHSFTVGDVLLAVPSRTPGRVDLADGTRHVGFLDGQSGEALRSALSGRDGGGGVHVEVVSKCDLSGVAQVRVREGGTPT